MKVLVTGGMGYIGSHTCLALVNAGFEPIIYDNLSNSSTGVLQQLCRISNCKQAFVEGDIRDTHLLQQVMTQHACEAVIHFAALKAVGESTEYPLRYYDNNVAGSLSLLNAMEECGVRNIVFSSSATVYGDPDHIPINESHPIRATNPYGWTKVMVEQMLKDTCAAQPQWQAISLRYFNPVGAHESGLLGENPLGIPNNLMPFIAQVAVGKRAKLQVFGNDYPTTDGTGIRDYIHVMDLAEGHVRALQAKMGQTGFFAYNLGTGQGYSVLEIVNSFAEASGQSIPYEVSPRRNGDIPCSYADPALAQQALKWRASRSLQQMTADVWRWQSNYPSGI
ncbi:UDP-glucose 4-epimerase GalE [Shewanella sp. D64]|uniref:UDP-glucose 4-epimerase GalE n=1 Tax=unclassified Shewanella TaxID=196818 RepID=UPI0022BA6AE1|nr:MULTISPECIES: UDP-glucose 4-epimerase GalE [unclassified Shewanella]MEC4724570.1 UDP-glucose 4-epimerase GalE [Shewanella sp. D64]MEC4736653.1 UDP-glucose 4-epimerase GalE [Shewanella sp. E94]WBJ94675.1 UDP-glucose 4-epimerase GalE [Shewanella sp. MTB7]